MDEEDVREAEEAKQLERNERFAGIGGLEDIARQRRRSLVDLLVPAVQDTMGARLLKKMGWKEGQGIGPKTMRTARDFDGEPAAEAGGKTFLFAPENSRLIAFTRKDNPQGLGYSKEEPISKSGEKDEEIFFGSASRPSAPKPKRPSGAAFGVGVLNDDGEDEEDIYEIRPKSAYNRVIGGDKPKKKTPMARPIAGKHVFVPKKGSISKSFQTARKCHDGRLPIPGFILSDAPAQLAEPRYPPPVVPDDWKGMPEEASASTTASDPADKPVASLNPSARGALLGEAPLPGKSVFDFLTPDARNRIANLTGNTNLPQGLGEAPVSSTRASIADIVPPLDPEAAMTALKGGYMPYGDDLEKQARYRSFLEVKAGLKEGLPDRVCISSRVIKLIVADIPQKYGMNTQDWAKEMAEFVGAARIFKPLTGSMATRFTTSTSSNIQGNMDRGIDSEILVHRPAAKEENAAEAAAKLGMYGPLTRSIIEFTPSRLLCKRFNVPFLGGSSASTGRAKSAAATGHGAGNVPDVGGDGDGDGMVSLVYETVMPPATLQVDADKNEALERGRASEEVFKKIFGDWDDGDDEDD